MIHSVDISDHKFVCHRCGNCCYTILREKDQGVYAYNFQGELLLNPKTSVAILYNEEYELEQNLLNYDLKARFYSGMVFFINDYPYELKYSTQLEVKKSFQL